MSVSQTVRKGVTISGAFAALALGGSALANAASGDSGAATAGSATSSAAAQRPDPTTPGGHVGANGKTEQALPAAVAAKVKAAAEAKVSDGTVERVETDVDHGSPYEAHVRKADGTELEVLVNKDFQVTAVNTMGRADAPLNAPGGPTARPDLREATEDAGRTTAAHPAPPYPRDTRAVVELAP